LVIQPSQLHGLTQITQLHLDDVRCDVSELRALLGKLDGLLKLHVVNVAAA
jgi:hypothetical protein